MNQSGSRRGQARMLLLEAARDQFNRKGYSTTSTREIAEHAQVSETLLFRYFGNKAGLFREAMVQPLVEMIDHEIARIAGRTQQGAMTREDTRDLVAKMYDVFHEHRALAALVISADALAESDLAELGVVDEVRTAIDRWVSFGAEQVRAHGLGLPPKQHDLAVRGHVAMVAGLATFGPWYFGKRVPSRTAVIDELTEWAWRRFSDPT